MAFILIMCLSLLHLAMCSVVTLQKGGSLYCIVSGEMFYHRAIYVYPLEISNPLILQKNSIKNRITYINISNHLWSQIESDQYNDSAFKLSPVVDKRWEEFKLEFSESILYENIPRVTSFSVFNASKLTVKILVDNSIVKLRVIPQQNFKEYVFNNWVHYTVTCDNAIIRIFQDSMEILKFDLFTYIRYFSPYRMLIENDRKTYWKRHKYMFYGFYRDNSAQVREISTDDLIFKVYFNYSGNFCISFMVAFCHSCKLTIELKYENTIVRKVLFDQNRKQFLELTKWKSVDMSIEASGIVELKIIPEYPDHHYHQTEKLWAVDLNSITSCSGRFGIKEYFQNDSYYNNKYTCRSLLSSNDEDYWTRKEMGYLSDSIACKDIVPSSPNCEQFKINWDQYPKSAVCAWGYKPPDCTEKCNSNFYGLDCKESCPQLCNNCNYQRGCLGLNDKITYQNKTNSSTIDSSEQFSLDEISIKDLIYLGDDNKIMLNCNQRSCKVNDKITVSIKCLDSWCQNQIQSDVIIYNVNNLKKEFDLYLHPFTVYEANINLQHGNMKNCENENITLKTHPGVPEPPSNLNLQWDNVTKNFDLICDYSSPNDVFITNIKNGEGNISVFVNASCKFPLRLDVLESYTISVEKRHEKYLSKKTTIQITVLPPLNNGSSVHPVIEKCNSNTTCQLMIFKELPVYLNLPSVLSDIEVKLINDCFDKSVNKDMWLKYPKELIQNGYYQKLRYGRSFGIILNFNNASYCYTNRDFSVQQTNYLHCILVIISGMIALTGIIICILKGYEIVCSLTRKTKQGKYRAIPEKIPLIKAEGQATD